ncbi:MAG TPA: hypothetical protein VE548_01140 [Nitrososphaeraceae archaeon]|nr:hypothetical protein [Nitrososphaeraceae archaeon]
MTAFCISIIILCLGAICLGQPSFDGFQTYAQEVPLIPIQSGNVTLDRGLPIFYDCLDNMVDESFSEQEDNYFKHEPRKSEVIECYYEVFVNKINNNGDSNFDGGTSDGGDNDEEIETDELENENEEEEEEGLFG